MIQSEGALILWDKSTFLQGFSLPYFYAAFMQLHSCSLR